MTSDTPTKEEVQAANAEIARHNDETRVKRAAGLAKARAAKAERAAKAKTELKFESEDADALRKKRAQLLEELAKLPDPPPTSGAVPGTLLKDGLGFDKVPWTPATLRDYCNRGVVVDGVPFGWKTIIGIPELPTVSWNGIVYWLFNGEENKVPSVHYFQYMQVLEDRRREAAKWVAPANPGRYDGYQTGTHVMGTGPLGPDTRGQ